MTDEEQVALFLSAGVSDEYRLTTLGFVPDVIYDIGADVGSITMFAHKTYQNAKIIAVEPNPWSFPRLVNNAFGRPNIVPIHAAVGQGQLYEPSEDTGPLHWSVVSMGAPSWTNRMVPSSVPAVTLAELYDKHGGERYVVKIDIEGGEYGIVTHPASRQVLLDSAYFAAEFHFWGATQEQMDTVVEALMRFLFDLAQTHTYRTYAYGACLHVWAKTRINGVVE